MGNRASGHAIGFYGFGIGRSLEGWGRVLSVCLTSQGGIFGASTKRKCGKGNNVHTCLACHWGRELCYVLSGVEVWWFFFFFVLLFLPVRDTMILYGHSSFSAFLFASISVA